MSRAVADGVLPTRTPAASSASFLASAVPDEPETIAPACPIVLPRASPGATDCSPSCRPAAAPVQQPVT